MAAGRLRAWEDVAGRATMGSSVNVKDAVMKQSRTFVSPVRCGFWGAKRERGWHRPLRQPMSRRSRGTESHDEKQTQT